MRSLFKKSFTLAGKRTSVALEPEFWAALEAMAAGHGLTLSRLVDNIATHRGDRSVASALRICALSKGAQP